MSTDSIDVVPVTPVHRVRSALGLVGLVLGVIGLAGAVARPYVEEALKPPPEKLSDVIADAGEKLVVRAVDHMRHKKAEPAAKQPPPPPARPVGWQLSVAATSLGFVGAVCGAVGWVRREDQRLAASATVAGSVAVALTNLVAALVIALAIVLLLVLRGALGA